MGKETIGQAKMPKDPGKPNLKQSIAHLEKSVDELIVAINEAKRGLPDRLINYLREKAGIPPIPPPPPDWLKSLQLDQFIAIAETMQANIKSLKASFRNLDKTYEATRSGLSK